MVLWIYVVQMILTKANVRQQIKIGQLYWLAIFNKICLCDVKYCPKFLLGNFCWLNSLMSEFCWPVNYKCSAVSHCCGWLLM